VIIVITNIKEKVIILITTTILILKEDTVIITIIPIIIKIITIIKKIITNNLDNINKILIFKTMPNIRISAQDFIIIIFNNYNSNNKIYMIQIII
jgi:hypothetical protein